MKHACIRFRTGAPDYSDLPIPVYDWSTSVYNNPKEVLPTDAPEPLGKTVVTTHYCDASLFHDMLTGKAVTATLHFVNQTPCDWFSKKQATVETAIYGSEFVAARTCVEQFIDIRNTLRYMGIPVEDRCYMFGQRVCCQQRNYPAWQTAQAPHHAVVPPCTRGDCIGHDCIHVHPWVTQPSGHSQQTLELQGRVAEFEGYLILEG